MIFTKEQGCSFNDQVGINLSPFDIVIIKNMFVIKTLDVKDSALQSDYQRIRDIFTQRHNDWIKERKKYAKRELIRDQLFNLD